jgi:hypothetical protein
MVLVPRTIADAAGMWDETLSLGDDGEYFTRILLAAESVLLLLIGQQRRNPILLVGAYIAAALSVGWGMDGLKQFDTPGLWLGIGLGVLMMVNTFLTHRQLAGRAAEVETGVSLRPQPSYFTVLALAIWLVATWDNTSSDIFPLIVAAEALVLTFSIYALRVREVTLFSQGFLLLALAGSVPVMLISSRRWRVVKVRYSVCAVMTRRGSGARARSGGRGRSAR